jgi:hypothetical protein
MSTNTENGGVILGRYKPTAAIASTEAEGYEIGSAFNLNPTQTYKSTGFTATINMTFPLDKYSGWGIINHNLTSTASINLRFFNEPTFTTPEREIAIPFNERNTYILIPDISDYSYIQLYVTDPNLSEIEIGTIRPGKWSPFPCNYKWGYQEEFCVSKSVDISDEGVLFETPNEDENEPIPECTKLKITFENVEREHYNYFKNLIRVGKKVLILDPSDQECFFGIFPDKTIPGVRKLEGDNFSLQFWEDAIGVSNVN